ncbi:heavy metal translocating P-type ATPase [Fictibacillus macauensis ZFHKF-1]|uniref:Heavy metal translocating P-type ATPase n=1 Tax=Fictibacillus macauensis ZFHKF-1 TaxID=1196324 RepID=I8J308_9BACL|nr:heavy metal translocating P-type ATPase [Fictibacillus macauensis]EIT86136.1 heavy metal translocating P-type ATPase [Fictibacillus macauensis ZFHKF-1]
MDMNAVVPKNEPSKRFLRHSLFQHSELMCALISGVLIITGWLLQRNDFTYASIFSYCIAFMIGGFAKAKEGLQETITERTLNVELLMVLAAIGSMIIGYWAEGAILIFIFAMSGALETYTLNKSNQEIASLMELQPEEALLLTSDKQQYVHVSSLQIGDLILVKAGERIGIDGVIEKGLTTIDESSITGEPLPVTKEVTGEVFAGTMNISGSIVVRVTKRSTETLFQKIIHLVQQAQQEKSPSQQFIESFEGKYVKGVLLFVALMMVVPHYLLEWSWETTFYHAIVLLVVASPCAVVASIMPATLSAISNCARSGILFKGGVHLENLGKIQAIVFDKTGTLTAGKLTVTDFVVVEGYDEQDVRRSVSSIEQHSNHPLAKAIVQYIGDAQAAYGLHHFQDVPGAGVRAQIGADVWKIGKAAFVGEAALDERFGEVLTSRRNEGKTLIFFQVNEEIVGYCALLDTIRHDAHDALHSLKTIGIHSIMLTGDHEKTAQRLTAALQMEAYIAECLPETKGQHIQKLKEQYESVAMVGDGINDAPALATANVGIAMGEGTDVAIDTADVILMKNELQKLPKAVLLSKRMNTIIKQNLWFSSAVIVGLIIATLTQQMNLPLGVIGHEGSTILVIMNGLRLLKG